MLGISGTTFAALSLGFLVFIHPGFADAGEVKGLQQSVFVMLKTQLERSIFDAREAQCKAGNPAERALYLRRLEEQRSQYQQQLSLPAPRLPSCEEFGVTSFAGTP